MANLPVERYLVRPSVPAGPASAETLSHASHQASVARIHMLGVMVVSGCHPRLAPASAGILLRDACIADSPGAVQLVLRCGSPDTAGTQLALQAAVERDRCACTREVLRCTGIDPTSDSSQALRLACRAGALGCVEELLAAGAAMQRCAAAQAASSRSGTEAGRGQEAGAGPAAAAASGKEEGHSAMALALAAAQAAAHGHTNVLAMLLRATRHPAALLSLALITVASGSACMATDTGAGVVGLSVVVAVQAVQALLVAGADPSAYGSAALLAACQRTAAGVQPAAATAAAAAAPIAAGPDTTGAVVEMVRELIRGGGDPRVEDSAPLVAACRAGADGGVVALLLQGGAEAGAQDGAPLRYACKHGAADAVTALLAAPPGAHTLFGLTAALAEAAAAGHGGLAEACLAGCERHGLHAQVVKDLALIQVAEAGCLPAVDSLLSAGASASACGSKGLAAAAEAGHEAVAAALLAGGADPTARDNAPLVGAALRGHTRIVQLLLAVGADPCARDSWALWVASEAGHMDTVAALMAAGADPTVQEDDAAGFGVSCLIDEMECDC